MLLLLALLSLAAAAVYALRKGALSWQAALLVLLVFLGITFIMSFFYNTIITSVVKLGSDVQAWKALGPMVVTWLPFSKITCVSAEHPINIDVLLRAVAVPPTVIFFSAVKLWKGCLLFT